MKYLIIVLLLSFISCGGIKTEYKIELVNQNEVLIKGKKSGKIYRCKPEQILETINNDNL